MSEVGSSSNSVEENRQNFNIDWRAEKRVFNEQMEYFCMKEEMADVEFVFNRQNKITVCFFLLFSLLPIPFVWYSLENSCSHICAKNSLRSISKRTYTWLWKCDRKTFKDFTGSFLKIFAPSEALFIIHGAFLPYSRRIFAGYSEFKLLHF